MTNSDDQRLSSDLAAILVGLLANTEDQEAVGADVASWMADNLETIGDFKAAWLSSKAVDGALEAIDNGAQPADPDIVANYTRATVAERTAAALHFLCNYSVSDAAGLVRRPAHVIAGYIADFNREDGEERISEHDSHTTNEPQTPSPIPGAQQTFAAPVDPSAASGSPSAPSQPSAPQAPPSSPPAAPAAPVQPKQPAQPSQPAQPPKAVQVPASPDSSHALTSEQAKAKKAKDKRTKRIEKRKAAANKKKKSTNEKDDGSSLKKLLGVLGVLVAAALIYFLFLSGGDPEPPADSTTSSTVAPNATDPAAGPDDPSATQPTEPGNTENPPTNDLVQKSEGCDVDPVVWEFTNEPTDVSIDTTDRTFFTTAPPQSSGTPRALIIEFHDVGQPLDMYGFLSTLDQRTVDADAVIVTAKGLGVAPQWNVAQASGQASDVAFTTEIINQVRQQTCIDTNRIFVLGFGQGAHMASTYACAFPDFVAGAILLGGPYVPADCPLKRNVSTFFSVAPDDLVFPPVEGGTGPELEVFVSDLQLLLPGATYTIPPFADTTKKLVEGNGCSPPETRDYAGKDVTLYDSCEDGSTIVVANVTEPSETGHIWPKSLVPQILEFVKTTARDSE